MKTKLLFLILLAPFIAFGQFTKPIKDIAEVESRIASKLMNFKVNPNTNDYDLKYHRIELNVDPSVAFLSGEVTSYFVAKKNIDQVIFELDNNMVVSQVIQRGIPLAFTQNNNDEVVIILPQEQNIGVLDSLTISYSGDPTASINAAFTQTTHMDDPIIYTLSQPYGAKQWWPCKQDLIDKIDVIDVYLTTPKFNPSGEEYIAVSNGLELGQVKDGDFKTTHFRHEFPIPAYLIAIAVSNYKVYTDVVPNNGNPFDIVNYVYPEDFAYLQTMTPVTVDIMDLFSNLFEEYPYSAEKYGHCQWNYEGAMEHTTVSFMGDFNRQLIAHELAHQWFGNKVTCGSWQDIWLNEGFASYLEGLVVEAFDGDSAFHTWRANVINAGTGVPGGSIYIPAEDTTSVSRIFNPYLTYNKSAMVLHMLRRKVGDNDFFTGLQNFLSDPNFAFGYAKTEDFIDVMESVSGEDLSEFFNDWIYDQGYPIYTIEWNHTGTNDIRVVINQSQSYPTGVFFEATVPLRLFGYGGEIMDIELDNTYDGEEYLVQSGFEVGAIWFDPEYHLISKYNEVVLSNDEMELENQIIVYPVPAKDVLHIYKPDNISIEQIQLFDMSGKMVMETTSSETINITHLESGIYFLKAFTGSGSLVKQFIIE